jgi:F-type H+-transporting ATPase subunit a
MEEVQDQTRWHFFTELLGGYAPELPSIHIGSYEFQLTKFMILEVVAALLIIAIYVPLAKRIKDGGLPTGWWWNLFETFFVFVRDQIARPNLDDPHGGHDDHGHAEHGHEPASPHAVAEHTGDRFVPFLATMFLFILFCNLLGTIPFLGSPTASIWVTGALALIAFIMLHAPGIYRRHGVRGYLASLWPHIDVPYVGWFFGSFIFGIELFGTVIKSFVLAVRLFANMFAGHMVLASILGFILMVGTAEKFNLFLWSGVTVASVLAVVALSLLELFVAFLQAYVFAFLTALFMGMSLNPEH